MRQLLNTLYVTTEGTYLHLDHETLKVELEGSTKLQVPLHHLGGVVCFGNVMVSPFLLHRCADDGRALVFLDRNGRFKARVEGPVSGNVLLLAASDVEKSIAIARNIVAGKIQNARQIVLRGGREGEIVDDIALLQECAEVMSNVLMRLRSPRDLDEVRGLEGEAARTYFSVFDRMVREDREMFCLNGRSRRPPLDRMNALLSFLYTHGSSECSRENTI
jgi:CRISP-associated protein Cas1